FEIFVSKRHAERPRRTFRPRLPRVPGLGFWRTILPRFPLPSLSATAPAVPAGTTLAIACRVQRGTAPPFKFCSAVTAPHCGSDTFTNLVRSKKSPSRLPEVDDLTPHLTLASLSNSLSSAGSTTSGTPLA